MENIQTYIIDGQEVFLADDLKQNNPVYFKGCSKTIRNIIGRKKIPDHHIVYATKTKTGYNACETDIKKARLFLTKEWVVPNFEFKEENNGDEVVDNKKYEEAPPLLFLSPEDKFRGADGETIEIETRGEREYDKVYFRSKDIENGFGCNIRALLFQENNSYIRGKHYETFIRKVKGNNPSNETQQNQKTLYLTFKGLTRFLFASHNKNAEHFQDWACKILFVHKMAHQDQKDDLADDLIGTQIGTVRDVFRSSVSGFPSIYLLEFGLVKDLRGVLTIDANVPDDHKIYKFGTTHDLKERLVLYNHKYGRDISLQLIVYAYIDVIYKISAEKDIREYCNKENVRLNQREEFIVLKNDHSSLKKIKDFFRKIHDCYIGSVRRCQEEMDKMKQEKQLLEQENKHLKEKIETQDKQIVSLETDKTELRKHIGLLFDYQSKYEISLKFIKSLYKCADNIQNRISDYLLS